MRVSKTMALVALSLFVGCGGGGEGKDDTGANSLAVPEFGADSPSYEVFADSSDDLDTPRDLAFHPDRDELWVMNQTGPGQWDSGNITVFDDPLGDNEAENYADAFAYHFMSNASGFAFGSAEYAGSDEVNFATCHESANDYNGTSAPDYFMGPTLWSSDLDIYANVNQGFGSSLGGSHLDMLHQSPLCMGIAHDSANVYWATDGDDGSVVRYDFQEDHGPGYDDHSDGVVRRFSDAEFSRVDGVPGHLVVDSDSGWLYYADTGEGKVRRLDTNSGSSAGSLSAWGEYLAEYTEWDGATVEVFASDLSAPSGIALHEGRLFVSDYDSGEIIAYDVETGEELGRIQTDASGITGLDVSSAGEIYFVDMDAEEVVRVIPG